MKISSKKLSLLNIFFWMLNIGFWGIVAYSIYDIYPDLKQLMLHNC